MKQIIKYTVGWDMASKEGYITLVDETQKSYVFGKMPPPEFHLLVEMLKENKVFIDNNNWIISGWEKEEHS